MPRRTKHYLVAATNSTVAIAPPVPTNPKRIALLVQNTGAQLVLMRFTQPVNQDGSDVAIAAGAIVRWDQSDTAPLEAIFFFCGNAAGSTVAVLETVSD